MEDGEGRLSDIGRIVDEDWRAIPNHYGNVTLDAFQIMPNHLHGIIVINESLSDKRGHARGASLRNEKNNLNYSTNARTTSDYRKSKTRHKSDLSDRQNV
ncbi:MAG: hypothetical protein AAB344_02995 [Bacteroidota bacterium]